MLLFRSILFTTYLFLSAVFFASGVLVLAPFPHIVRFKWVIFWARSVLWMLERLCRLKYTVEGIDNLPEQNTVVMLKHSSAWETIAEFVIFPSPQCWVLKQELMLLPFIGWALKLMKPIAIDRKAHRSAVDTVVEQGCKRLDEGFWVMIFPEGTRVAPGDTKRYGISGALLAKKAGHSIVPVAHNAGDFWPRRGWVKKPGTIRVIVGPPISTDCLEPRAIAAAVQTWVDTTVGTISAHYDIG